MTMLTGTTLANRVLTLLAENQDRMTECSLAGYYLDNPVLVARFEHTRISYTAYVSQRVRKVVCDMNLSGWVASADAPQSYDAIIDEVYDARRNRKPFRVWNGASNDSVFLHPSANHAFRCIHDLYHYAHAKDFSLASEEWLARHWTNEIAIEQPKLHTILLAACDGIGQVYYGKHSVHDFVDNQIVFVKGLFMWLLNTLAAEGAL